MNEEEILQVAKQFEPFVFNHSNRMVEDGHTGETWFNEGIDIEWMRSFPGKKCYRGERFPHREDKTAYAVFCLLTEEDGSLLWMKTDWRKGDVFGEGDNPYSQGLIEGPEHLRKLLFDFFA